MCAERGPRLQGRLGEGPEIGALRAAAEAEWNPNAGAEFPNPKEKVTASRLANRLDCDSETTDLAQHEDHKDVAL
jgi:hypothetical protein